MDKRINSQRLIALIGIALMITIGIIVISVKSCAPTKKNTPIESPPKILTFQEKLNNINWELSYYSNNFEIITIIGKQSENERSSVYAKQLAFRLGDSSAYCEHTLTYNGTPIGDDWYRIELTEQYINGWNPKEILSTRTFRYEEKITFTDFLSTFKSDESTSS